MKTLLMTKSSAVWLLLVVLTATTWTLASDQAQAHLRLLATLVIIGVAVFKIRLIALFFMELREAPPILRGLFDGYCAVLFVVLSGVYVLA